MNPAAAVLEEARVAAGKPSFDKVRLAVYDRLGAYAPSAETIRTYHRADGPKPDLTVLAALCDVYGIKLASFGITTPSDLHEMLRRVSDESEGYGVDFRSRCFTDGDTVSLVAELASV